jgi:hypothetical protein
VLLPQRFFPRERDGLPLNDLAPRFAPHSTRPQLAGDSRAREQVPAGERYGRDLALNWDQTAASQPTTAPPLSWGLLMKRAANLLPPGKRSSEWQAKKPSDLRSLLTESNRRPSPYHGPPDGPVSAAEALSRQNTSSRKRRRAQISSTGCVLPPKMPTVILRLASNRTGLSASAHSDHASCGTRPAPAVSWDLVNASRHSWLFCLCA